jgi:hypothetical protein
MTRLQRLVVCTLLAAAAASLALAAHMRTAAADSDRILAGDAEARVALAAEQRRLTMATADVRHLAAAYAALRRATAAAEGRLVRAIRVTARMKPRHRNGSVRIRYVRRRGAGG